MRRRSNTTFGLVALAVIAVLVFVACAKTETTTTQTEAPATTAAARGRNPRNIFIALPFSRPRPPGDSGGGHRRVSDRSLKGTG